MNTCNEDAVLKSKDIFYQAYTVSEEANKNLDKTFAGLAEATKNAEDTNKKYEEAKENEQVVNKNSSSTDNERDNAKNKTDEAAKKAEEDKAAKIKAEEEANKAKAEKEAAEAALKFAKEQAEKCKTDPDNCDPVSPKIANPDWTDDNISPPSFWATPETVQMLWCVSKSGGCQIVNDGNDRNPVLLGGMLSFDGITLEIAKKAASCSKAICLEDDDIPVLPSTKPQEKDCSKAICIDTQDKNSIPQRSHTYDL